MTSIAKIAGYPIDTLSYAEREREKLCNKQINIFDYTSNLVMDETDNFASEKNIEEKNKKIWKSIVFGAIGAIVIGGCVLIARKLHINNLKIKEMAKNPVEDAGEYIRKHWDVCVNGSEVKIYDKNSWCGSYTHYCKNSRQTNRTAKELLKSKKDYEVIHIKDNKVIVNTYNRMELLKDIKYKTPEEAKLAAEYLSNLKEPWSMYRKNLYTVIKSKDGEMIDLSKIDKLIGGSRIVVKYNSPEEAKRAAKELLMKQFKKPLREQVECAITVEGKHVTGISCGVSNYSDVYRPIFSNSKADIYHNHPFCGADQPLSGTEGYGDIDILVLNKLKSITAYNRLGEYNTARIIDYDEFYKNDKLAEKVIQELRAYEVKDYLGKEQARRWLDVQAKYESAIDNEILPSEELEREYEFLLQKIKQSPVPWHTNQELALWQHKGLKEILPINGIKYTTNYSNLKGA